MMPCARCRRPRRPIGPAWPYLDDAEKTPDTGRRAAETKRILGEALTQLGEAAMLDVHNLTFCTEVYRFGPFDAVKSTEFTAGQKVLLYAEVDNLHIESTPKGYHWAVKVNGQTSTAAAIASSTMARPC